MSTSPRAKSCSVQGGALVVVLEGGRIVRAPLSAFPRLRVGSPSALATCEILGGGEGLHWPELDEDLSVRGLVRDFGLADENATAASR